MTVTSQNAQTAGDQRQVGAVVGGVAGQPVYRVARALVADAGDRTAVSISGNPDARPGKAVEAHARLGGQDEVLTPLVMAGECHLVIGLEPLEALRAAVRYFTPGMHVVSLTERVVPTTVLHKGAAYPDLERAGAELEKAGATVTWVDGGVDDASIARLLEHARASLAARD